MMIRLLCLCCVVWVRRVFVWVVMFVSCIGWLCSVRFGCCFLLMSIGLIM